MMSSPPPGGIYPYLTAVFIISTVGGIDGAAPVTKLCRPASCSDSNCEKVSCVYGNCSPEGTCVCSACYTGSSCDVMKNDYYPKFIKERDSIIVPENLHAGDLIAVMAADDPDTNLTCHYDHANCPCSQMLYSIESGDKDGLFAIDERTGVVTVTRDVSGRAGGIYKLYLSVVNKAVDSPSGDLVGPKDYALLTVGIGRNNVANADWSNDNSESPHARHRRATGPQSYVSNTTFQLIKTGKYNSTTSMMVGSKVHFQLVVTFPVGTTDLDVELFTPDNVTTVMVICSPQITWIGANLVVTNRNVTPVLSAQDNTNNYNWAVIDFGNVTNINVATNGINDTQIWIEWDVVMLDTAVNSTQYWVSAGAQYNNQNEIWIGQAGFNSFIDAYNVSSVSPSFNISGPSQANVGQTLKFRVDMYLPAPVSDVVFEAFAPINYTDSLTICNALVVSAGDNYACLQYQTIPFTTYPSVSGLTNERATINLGRLINAGSREPPTPFQASVIGVEFLVYIPVNATWVGQTIWVGAAVAVGTDQIWAGEIGFTVANSTLTDTVLAPVFSANSTGNASVNVPFRTDYTMIIPNNTDTTYIVEVTAGTNYKVCSIQITYSGVNLPCLNQLATPVYNPINKVVWNLGRIRNAAQRSLSRDPLANTLQFIIWVQPLNVSANTINSAYNVEFKTTYGTVSSTVTSTGLLVANSQGLSSSSSPVSTMTYKFGNGVVPVNASTDLRLSISTYPNAIYTPVYLEITVPYGNGSNIFSICRVEVVSVGTNLPCVNMTALNSSVQYYAVSNYSGFYKAVLQLDSICNSKQYNSSVTYVPTAADTIELSVIVRVENALATLSNGSVKWVGAGLSYTPGILWLGSESITAMVYNNYHNYNTSTKPPFISFASSTSGNWSVVPAGSLASFLITVKLPPQSVGDWTFSANVSNNLMLSVCQVRIKEYGRGIACLNRSTPMRVDDRPNSQGRRGAWLDLYKVTNVGTDKLYYDPIFDNNTFVVEVVVMVGAGAQVGSTMGVFLTADYGMNGVDNSTNLWFNVAPPVPTEFLNSTLPTNTLSLAPVNSNDTLTSNNVFKGQTVILVADVTVPTGSQHSINFTLLGPPGSLVDIVVMDVVSIGLNLPCITRKQFTSNITSYTNSYTRDVANMNMGLVCSWPIDTSSPDNDKVRIEAVVTIVRNSTAQALDQIVLSSVLNVNGTDTAISSLTLTVTDQISSIELPDLTTLGMANLLLNVSNSSLVQLYPADMFSLDIVVTIAPNSSVFSLVDVKLPVDNFSAVMTVVSMTVVSFGINVGSFESALDFVAVTNSTYGSTQMDRAYLDLGKITNTGHSYRADKYQPGDDSIRIALVMQMADALSSNRSSMHTISVGARLGMPMMFRNLQVQTARLLNERADLILAPTLNNTTPTQLSIDVILRHSNVSRAETYNTSVFFYLSNYAVFYSLMSTNFTGPYPNVTNMTANNGVSITFSRVYFTDIIQFTVQLLVVPTSAGNYSNMLTVASSEVLHTIIYRPGHTNALGTVFQSWIVPVNYSVTPPFQPQCTGAALGMQSGLIQDCQLSSSYSPSTSLSAENARLSTGSGWVSGNRYGPFDRYYQVNFGNLTMINSITLQPATGFYYGSSSPSAVTQYQLFYSNDSINWVSGPVIATNGARQDQIPNPYESVYLRLLIQNPGVNQPNAGFKIEFNGCVTGIMPAQTNGQCNLRQGYQKPAAAIADFSPRNFVVSSSIVYFCDSNPTGSISCFMSDSLTPNSWQPVDSMVVNVLGILQTTPALLFGIDSSQRAIVVSETDGATWLSLNPQRYAASKAQTSLWTQAVVVPWIWDSSSLTTASTQFSISGWNAYFDGLKKASGTLLVDWNSCCP